MRLNQLALCAFGALVSGTESNIEDVILGDTEDHAMSLLQVNVHNFDVAEAYVNETQPGSYCQRGVREGRICCGSRCGSCGGSGCQNRPGGSACCTTQIQRRNRRCTGSADSNCMIPREPHPTIAPTIDDQSTVQAMALCEGGRTLDLTSTTILQSNLGGQGPDGGAETLVYGGVFPGTNLVISALSPYTPNLLNANGGVLHNGLHGGFGVINMACDSSVDLKFQFVDANTGTPVTPAPFVFTWFDSDHGMAHTSREAITVRGFTSYHVTDNAALDIAEIGSGLGEDALAAGQGEATFTSTMRGGKVDNPTSPLSLSRLQADRTVAILFQDKSEFTVTLSETGYANPQGRNFYFSGSSALVCPEDAKCTSYTCPTGFSSRMNAEFLVCAGRPCGRGDRDTCCYENA